MKDKSANKNPKQKFEMELEGSEKSSLYLLQVQLEIPV
jgi:hypothetical protein